MRKRKSPTTSKNPGKGKMAAKAKQAIVKSPKHSRVPLAAQVARVVKIREAPLRDLHRLAEKENKKFEESSKDSQVGLATGAANASVDTHPNDLRQDARVAEISQSSQRGHELSAKETKGFDIFSATTSTQSYEGKLLEISSANLNFAFEFAQRLARVRSPVEFLAVGSEFTSKRMAMFLRHSKELADLVLRRSRFG
jgi:hypothetical protein